jgi:hypothetical protein
MMVQFLKWSSLPAQEAVDEFGQATKRRGGGGGGGMTVLDVDAGHLYRPKTRETREAYEALLAVIHQQFGEQPEVRTSVW